MHGRGDRGDARLWRDRGTGGCEVTGMTRIPSGTLADRAFEQIEAAIVTGELAPGTKISEVTLARTLGVSRGPLREAIRRLEGRKLVHRVPHVGTAVVALSADDILEIMVVREALEGMACRLAARHVTPAELDELDRVLDQHAEAEALRTGQAYYQAPGHLDFHYRIALASKNRKIVEILGGELYHLIRVYRYRSGAALGRPKQALEEHRDIVVALRAHDCDLSERLMRQHIAQSRTNLETAASPLLNVRGRDA